MKILLTGQSGFVGTYLINILSGAGYSVIGISKSSGYDLEEPFVFNELPDSDLIIHLAGAVGVERSWENPESYYRINYLTTLSVAEYARKRKVPIIFLSSYMYGYPDYLPVDEKHPVNCNNPYAYSKKMSEDILFSYNKLFGVAVKIVRPMNLYGRGMAEGNIIGLILRQTNIGDTIHLRDLSPRRDYLHIEDLSFAICQIIKKGHIEGLDIYNLGFGKSYSVAEIIEELGMLMGKKFKVIETGEKRINEIADCYADITKFSKEFEWKPVLNLKDGLLKTLGSC